MAVKYIMQFCAGESKWGSDFVNYMLSTDDSIYAEIKVPEDASEDYGYLTLKRAILERIPDADIEWWYSPESEAKLEADASAEGEVRLDIQIDEDEPEDDPEVNLWYAVVRDREDTEWGNGSKDKDEAIRMARAWKDMYPDVHILVIDDGDDPVCIDTIELDDEHPEMEEIQEEEGLLITIEGGLGRPEYRLHELLCDGTIRLEWEPTHGEFRGVIHWYKDVNEHCIKVLDHGGRNISDLEIGIDPCIAPPEHLENPDPVQFCSSLARDELIDQIWYALRHGFSRKVPGEIIVKDKGLVPQSSLESYLVVVEDSDGRDEIDHVKAPAGYTIGQYLKDCEDNSSHQWMDMLYADDIRRIWLEHYNSETGEYEEVPED